MKTPQQLSEEVLQKISARKEKEKRIYRNVARVSVVIAVTAIVIPLALMFNDTSLKNEVLEGAGGNAAMPSPEYSTNFDDAGEGAQKPNKPEDTSTENAPGEPEFEDGVEDEVVCESEETDSDSEPDSEPDSDSST